MFEVVRKINHLAAGEVEVNGAHGPRTKGDLRNCLRRHIDAEEMQLAFHAGFEIDRLAVFRPFQAAGNQIKSIRSQYRHCAATRRRQPNFRMIAIVKFAGEGDPFAVR